ncbi:MAG TPA: alpha/beta hydrolase [Candidatus Saccharimonadales bacterium]|nr:alpha/beta hydrolase [Candidatus Saccharimonadales bacterium]
MPIHILYISGLGDRYDSFRRFCLRFWRLFGVTAELVSMSWTNGATYEEKVKIINQRVDAAKNKRIVLIGESAGGSTALNMYAARPNNFYKVMTICGKNTKADHVSPHLYRKNPAFKTSMYQAEKSVALLSKTKRQAFISVHPLVDHVVPVRETLIPDCQRVQLWTIGHLGTIAFALTLGSFIIIRIAKRPPLALY